MVTTADPRRSLRACSHRVSPGPRRQSSYCHLLTAQPRWGCCHLNINPLHHLPFPTTFSVKKKKNYHWVGQKGQDFFHRLANAYQYWGWLNFKFQYIGLTSTQARRNFRDSQNSLVWKWSLETSWPKLYSNQRQLPNWIMLLIHHPVKVRASPSVEAPEPLWIMCFNP